ncbi:hypothetical protein BC834DRAFT_554275 [Gloeopeniophorella convolvens]|nr:hypothetical protein BC834DRAFT_554275 [Gloeopeniophorella convolvens]
MPPIYTVSSRAMNNGPIAGPSRAAAAAEPPLWVFLQAEAAKDPYAWLTQDDVPLYPPRAKGPLSSSAELAARLQRQFDDEDRALAAERATLAAAQQRVFDCGVCMDTLPEDEITTIEPCGHAFCRECMRGLVVSQIDQRRFPVLCPGCTAGPGKGADEIGKVTQQLVIELGITEQQYEVWTEMEMSELFLSLHCRKCDRSNFFDREMVNDARNLICLFDDCDYTWCKTCQQEITRDGPEHSCDGTTELNHLVQQEGWKFCPTCHTPCEKISGCNFMSCISPGCNSHFCYKCAQLVVRSAVPLEIGTAKSLHFTKCAAY